MPRPGPDIERIDYVDWKERAEAREEFWRVVNGGHNTHDWSSASMIYWALIEKDKDNG